MLMLLRLRFASAFRRPHHPRRLKAKALWALRGLDPTGLARAGASHSLSRNRLSTRHLGKVQPPPFLWRGSSLAFIDGSGRGLVLTGTPASYRMARSSNRFFVKGSADFARSRTQVARSLLNSSSMGLPNNPEYTGRLYHLFSSSCVWLSAPGPACVPLFGGMPGFIKPQLAILRSKAPKRNCLHEIKYDGYRI